MATIYEVLGSDTMNEGRVKWNNSQNNVNVALVADIAALASHKAADDHAATYAALSHNHAGVYAGANSVADLTSNQTIAGEKSFTSDPIIKTGNTGCVVITAANNAKLARFRGFVNGNDTGVALDAYSNLQTQWVEMMRAYPDDATADFPYVDVYCRGKALATQEYVQERVRSGFYVIDCAFYTANFVTSNQYVTDGGGKPQAFPIPDASVLKAVNVLYRLANNSIGDDILRVAEAIAFTTSGYRWLYVRVNRGTSAFDVYVGAGRLVAGVEEVTWTLVDTVAGDSLPSGDGVAISIYFGLEFSR